MCCVVALLRYDQTPLTHLDLQLRLLLAVLTMYIMVLVLLGPSIYVVQICFPF